MKTPEITHADSATGDPIGSRLFALERRVASLEGALGKALDQQFDTIRMVRELTAVINRMTDR